MFGVEGSALAWIKSYLEDRSQVVVIDGCTSQPRNLVYGVPQGSVLGPLLFTCYTTPLSKVIAHHGLKRHHYADDSQVYRAFSYLTQEAAHETQKVLVECLKDVSVWMSSNKLKLNQEKTVLMVYNSRERISATRQHFGPLTISGHTINVCSCLQPGCYIRPDTIL